MVFVGDHEIIAEGLHAMLAGRDDQVELVGHVLPRKGHLETAIRLGADVVLLESPMQGSSGLDLLAEKPPVPVVVFADDADERRLFEALRRGASGYLLKSLSAAQLVDHLVRARTGEVVVDPALASRVALRSVYDGTGEAWPGRLSSKVSKLTLAVPEASPCLVTVMSMWPLPSPMAKSSVAN